jgi:ribosomal protein S14
MARKTSPVPHNKSNNILVKGKSNLKTPPSLIIPGSSVMNTKSGPKIHKNFTPNKGLKDDLCTHCGVRQKGPGFRFLCRYCFRKAGDETVYSINSGSVNKDVFSQKIPW